MQRGLLKEYATPLSILTKFIDIILCPLAGLLAYLLKFQTIDLQEQYAYALVIGALLVLPINTWLGCYRSLRAQQLIAVVRTVVFAVVITMLSLASIAFITKTGAHFSRGWFLYWSVILFVMSVLFRLVMLGWLHYMRRVGLNQRRVILIGGKRFASRLTEQLEQATWTGFHITEVYHEISDVPANFASKVARQGVDEVWFALPLQAERQIKDLLNTLRHNVITIRYFPDLKTLDLLNHSITEMLGFPVINIQATPMTGMDRIIKAIEDRILSALILLLISPVFLTIALAVKLTSKGPVFFKQQRHGWDGKPIWVYKFRSMYLHEEKGVTQAKQQDKRITPIGRFIRCTSLDELPQFINVLQGRMSIVGPRPHAIEHNEQYKDSINAYMQRHQVKPGITGWAQVNGWRGETDTLEKMQKRIDYDLYYINHWSLWFDLKIIALTLIKGFVHSNAY